MAEPILSVRDLKTYFLADEGTVRAVDGTSFDLFPGQTLGIVGESGCGKSVTARSILRIVERPGRIVGGQILLRRADNSVVDLTQLPPDGAQMRMIRGGEIGLVFQEPMSSLSAFHTIGNQLIEAIRLHAPLSKRAARARAIELLAMVGIPRPAQHDLTADDAAGAFDDAQDGARGHALAAAGFTDDAQRLSRKQIERGAVDSPHRPLVGEEIRLQVAHGQDGFSHTGLPRRASRRRGS